MSDNPRSLESHERGPSGPPVADYFLSFEDRIAELERESPMSGRTRSNLDRALSMIDPEERRAFLDRHRDRLHLGWFKYADFPYWAHRNVLQAERLDLDRSPPLDVLDIGMGSGSFAMVLRSMGHRVIGTDVPNRWYDDFCSLAGVERRNAPVNRGERYRPVDGRFDLISIMMPNFHRGEADGRLHYWPLGDWQAFLRGAAADLLNPNGRFFILMPPDRRADGSLADSPLIDWAMSMDARISGNANGLSATEIVLEGARVLESEAARER